MTYAEAMKRFVHKPDLRNPPEFVDVADIVKDCEFKVFRAPAQDKQPRGCVARTGRCELVA